MSFGDPLAVEAVRGDIVESSHLVDVAVCAPDGSLRAWAGEPETVAYLRSAAKPIQATVCTELGWEPPATSQLAVACASHNGEPLHVDAVRVTLAAAGLDASALRCPPASPSVVGDAPSPAAYGPIYHNCSGKHAAMLATCVVKGWDVGGYRRADTELQRAVQARVEAIAGRSSRGVATDGCGVPTYAFTLSETAAIYARLRKEAAPALAAMRSHPDLVAGRNRICTAVMGDVPGVVLKVGAEGLMCGVLLDTGTGFALKARDGAARGREFATVHVLEALGVLVDGTTGRILADVLPRALPGEGQQPVLRVHGSLEQA